MRWKCRYCRNMNFETDLECRGCGSASLTITNYQQRLDELLKPQAYRISVTEWYGATGSQFIPVPYLDEG